MFHKALTDIFPDPPADLDPEALDEARVPEHIAVIMDGNGRWAKKRALNRLRGHNISPSTRSRPRTGSGPTTRSSVS